MPTRLDGGLYVFINRRGTQIRVLYFDRSGFCLWAKRLEAGRFVSDGRTLRMDRRAAASSSAIPPEAPGLSAA